MRKSEKKLILKDFFGFIGHNLFDDYLMPHWHKEIYEKLNIDPDKNELYELYNTLENRPIPDDERWFIAAPILQS